MKTNCLMISVAILVLCQMSCASKNQLKSNSAAPAYEVLDLPKVNIKSFQKNSDGAYVIFDGTSLEGWRGYGRTNIPSKWSVDNGTLKFTGKPQNIADAEGGDLVFACDVKNFELELEWKVSKGGNSGIFYLAREIKGQPIYVSAPEYQLLDNQNHPDAKLGKDNNRKSGSLYDMIPANPQNAFPFGEWNRAKIVVNKGKVTHYQNDEKVLEYTLWTPEWTKLLQESKFSQEKWPLAFELLNNVGGKSRSGLIGLQDHGDDIWFRNITVKIL